MRHDHLINDLAEGQHALVASWQLSAHGLRRRDQDRLGDGRRWQWLTERVLVRCGVPWSDDRRLMAAVLDASPGAAIAAESAAAMWGLAGYRVHPTQVNRHRGMSRRESPLARIHEVVDLLPHHIKVVRGIAVVSPARVICELTATQHPKRVERNLEWLIREGLLDGGTFRRTVHDLAGRGRKGSPIMRELDAPRGPGYRPHDSGTEMRFAEILQRDGQKPMRRQVDVIVAEEWTGRVDFRDEDLPLIVEVQSEKYHTLLLDAAADVARREALDAAGYAVLEAWDTDIWHNPRTVVDRVRAERARLRTDRLRHS
jgi:very-short-patch-repair endonuclease